ncbi:MAG TPA: glycosyltransferase family 2 protein [Methanocorpusculum sp.]|nr:glycosyltransferase family 2 protein [Methanocorpusculum sp.]
MSDDSYPLISIIVPVYNVEPYLRRCLDSVLNQSYKNLEIILVASDSKDMSVTISDEFAKKDKRVTAIHSPALGLSDARNKGIDASHGEFLSFVDSDDYIDSDFISILFNICRDYACDVAECGFVRVDTEENSIFSENTNEIRIFSGRDVVKDLCGERIYSKGSYSWCRLYHKHIFSSIRFPFGKLYEDEATTYKLLYSVKKIGITTRKLYYYRTNPESIVGKTFSIKNMDILDFQYERVLYFKQNGDMELYHICLKNYVNAIPFFVYMLHTYVPSSKDEQKALRKMWRNCYSEARSNCTFSLKERIKSLILYYMPIFIKKLSRLLKGTTQGKKYHQNSNVDFR